MALKTSPFSSSAPQSNRKSTNFVSMCVFHSFWSNVLVFWKDLEWYLFTLSTKISKQIQNHDLYLSSLITSTLYLNPQSIHHHYNQL